MVEKAQLFLQLKLLIYFKFYRVVGICTREEKCSVEAGQMKKELLNDDQKKTFDKGCEALKHEYVKVVIFLYQKNLLQN